MIGGNGKTGRRVIQRLTALGVPVRGVSRSSAVPFDWATPSTWAPAVRGSDALYITYHPDLAFPDAPEAIRGVADAAVGEGVRRLVLLSGRGEEEAVVAEQGVIESGAAWTVVRGSWFDQNFSEGALAGPVQAGVIALPAGDQVEPFLDVEDLADVVVKVLTEDGHDGRAYDLTGPRLLSLADVAAEISRAAGREIRYIPVSTEEYTSSLVGYGVPKEEAALLAALFTKILDGRNAHTTTTVQDLLGRAPRDFTVFAREAFSG
ncbi:NmrA family transcriptional regulator [Acrocarpospora corrugata]|uniref:NmrA family transcriptional regulator n=1 Tax=Acrocarpospora corrugata TaxID=35763 RepID=A0A5M3VV77_9ACTN|nr:NmrA family transcriptional regulator [Acrocarpospora corrugata]